MRIQVSKPCDECPFRTDRPGFLSPERAREIAHGLTVQGVSFPCHKTFTHDEDDEGNETTDFSHSLHCAGAIIMLEHAGRPNQHMQIAERLGLYTPGVSVPLLDTVAHSPEEFVRYHESSPLNRPYTGKEE